MPLRPETIRSAQSIKTLLYLCALQYTDTLADRDLGNKGRDARLHLYTRVPKAGLEPAQLAPHAPETCVSTNFTTSANVSFYVLN